MRIVTGIVLALGLAAATPVMAADMAVKARPMAPVMAPLWSWSGLYAGLNAGYGWADQTITATAGATGSISTGGNGLIGGAQIGYNWQLGALVLGVEADIQASGMRGNTSGTITVGGVGTAFTGSSNIDYFGTVRGRIGYAAGSWMPYFTGGWAYGGSSATTTATIGGVATSFNSTGSSNNGYVLGGGIEFAGWAPNWTVKAEYLYLNFPGSTATGGGVTLTASDTRAHIGRLGINYHF